MKNFDGNEETLVNLADQITFDFLSIEPGEDGFTKAQEARMKQTIIGFKVKQEVTKNRRSKIDQQLRGLRFLKNADDRESYIRQSMPKLLPELKKRP